MEVQKVRDITIVRLTEEDLTRRRETCRIVSGLLADGERKFVADLAEVGQVDSLQAGTLFTLHALCYEHLAVMKLANASKKVKVVLRLIGLEKIMEIHHGPEVALASFGPPEEAPPPSQAVPPAKP